jgi:hypothetical protein
MRNEPAFGQARAHRRPVWGTTSFRFEGAAARSSGRRVPRRVLSIWFGAGLRPPTDPHPVTPPARRAQSPGGCRPACPTASLAVPMCSTLSAWAFTCSAGPASL